MVSSPPSPIPPVFHQIGGESGVRTLLSRQWNAPGSWYLLPLERLVDSLRSLGVAERAADKLPHFASSVEESLTQV